MYYYDYVRDPYTGTAIISCAVNCYYSYASRLIQHRQCGGECYSYIIMFCLGLGIN